MNKKDMQKNNRLLKTYGITLEDWNKMFDKQQGVCYICETMPPNKILCVDHIHQKGYKQMDGRLKKKYVRGLLCYLCNTGLKGFEKTADGHKNRNRLEGTYRYFKEFPLKGEI